MNFSDFIKNLQRELNSKGESLVVDGDPGPKTRAALEKYDVKVSAKKTKEKKSSAPWYWFLKKYEGKVETEPSFNKEMSAKWKLVGLDLKTISKNWAAWCGPFIAVGLAGVGYNYQKNGATAKNWDKYGVSIDWRKNGFPQGAIVRINSSSNCSSASGNHVTMANGDCSAKDLLKPGATFSGYGGNQGNKAKISTYRVSKICSVKWPEEAGVPPNITTSKNCSNGKTSDESTR